MDSETYGNGANSDRADTSRETGMAAPTEPSDAVKQRGFLYRLRAATGQPLVPSTGMGENFILTRLADAVQWGRKYSFFPYPFVTACCGMEYMSASGPRFDLDR